MQNNKLEIQSQFNAVAFDYDGQRKKLIPCFDDFYGTALALAHTNKPVPNILDLGAGTGLLSSFMLSKYPQGRITMIDLSDQMLNIARQRFKDKKNVRFIVADYSNYEFGESFDLIVSSLSIHHQNSAEKISLFQQVYTLLEPGGIFINADQVLGPNPDMERQYKEHWKRFVESSDFSAEEINQAYKRAALDKMDRLEDQMGWLRQVGFCTVDVVFKSYSFTVMYARKA